MTVVCVHTVFLVLKPLCRYYRLNRHRVAALTFVVIVGVLAMALLDVAWVLGSLWCLESGVCSVWLGCCESVNTHVSDEPRS